MASLASGDAYDVYFGLDLDKRVAGSGHGALAFRSVRVECACTCRVDSISACTLASHVEASISLFSVAIRVRVSCHFHHPSLSLQLVALFPHSPEHAVGACKSYGKEMEQVQAVLRTKSLRLASLRVSVLCADCACFVCARQ